jgi:dihydroxy-acid dehydratase
VFAERAALNRRAGRTVTEAVLRGTPLPRDIVTRKALENACAVVAATGGSTNAVLHIPAIANEAGIAFDIDDVAVVFARTPLIGNLQPGGRYLARDIHEIGGAPVVLRELLRGGRLHGDALLPAALSPRNSPPPQTPMARSSTVSTRRSRPTAA